VRTLIYISGPSCSGKTTLLNRIKDQFPIDEVVTGDEHWINFPGLSFVERVPLVNTSILDAVKGTKGSLVACEWVPIDGSFPCSIRFLCRNAGMSFLQIALIASTSVLQSRKMARDGDIDTDEFHLCSSSMGDYCLVVDTGVNDVNTVFLMVKQWLSGKLLQQNSNQAIEAD